MSSGKGPALETPASCRDARPYQSEAERTHALTDWSIGDNDHRSHTACHDQSPARRTPTRVNNDVSSST